MERRGAVLYVHGKGGSAAEREHYAPLFPDCEVLGLDYRGSTPWEAGAEIRAAVETLEGRPITLIANSIGAYFSLHAGLNGLVERACFISPIVDMERLIGDLLHRTHATETELAARGTIRTEFGEELSWDYLCWVRSHPVDWRVPTRILCGGMDLLSPPDTLRRFAGTCGAKLTVMEQGEHWFHTPEQMRFLDAWIRNCAAAGWGGAAL